MIRPMTTEEIRHALWHSADLCIELGEDRWWITDITMADAVFRTADAFAERAEDQSCTGNPMHSAMFLLFVAEAL